MAKLTLTDISNISGNPTTAENNINTNNALIETALENTLSRDGSTPNTMGAQLDMNSNRVINLTNAVNDQDAATLAQVVAQTFADQAGNSGKILTTDGTDTSWSTAAGLGLLLDTTDIFTGNLDIIGTAGVGIARTEGTLHVHTASAGAVTPPATADDLVVENSAACGISILATDTTSSLLNFGSPSDASAAAVKFNHNNDIFTLGTSKAGAQIAFETANGAEIMRMDASQNVVIGNTTAAGKLDVDQASLTGAIPVLYLDQADVSEEFIRFDATEATGNAVEDVAAKSLTVTKFVRINVNGTDLYMGVGTIA